MALRVTTTRGDYRICTKDVDFNPDTINTHLGQLLNSRDPSYHQSYSISAVKQQQDVKFHTMETNSTTTKPATTANRQLTLLLALAAECVEAAAAAALVDAALAVLEAALVTAALALAAVLAVVVGMTVLETVATADAPDDAATAADELTGIPIPTAPLLIVLCAITPLVPLVAVCRKCAYCALMLAGSAVT